MKKSLLLSSAALSLLAACGDEITEVNQPAADSGMQVVAAGEKLSKCTDDNVGTMVYVADSSAVFYCADGKWKSVNGKDGEDGENGSSSTDTIFVSNTDTIVAKDTSVVNKIDTLVVKDTLVVLDTVSRVDTLYLNSKDTLVVRDTVYGLNGKSCAVSDDGEGRVTLTCETDDGDKSVLLYKALCEREVYDPENKICLDKGLVPLCGEPEEGSVVLNTNGTMYSCKNGSWTKSSEREIVVGKVCLEADLGEMRLGSDEISYVCRNEEWVAASSLEVAIGKSCTDKNQRESTPLAYSNWVCRSDSIGWVYDFENLNRDSLEYAGRKYKTIGIGEQMWFAENLNYADSVASPNLKGNTWCFDNDTNNCANYGRLYTWTAALDLPAEYKSKLAGDAGVLVAPHRGICPEGWHVPSRIDWNNLIAFVKANVNGVNVSNSLKATSGWSSAGAKDLFGFSAKGTGWRTDKPTFADRDKDENLWSITEDNASAIWYADFQYAATANDFAVYNSGANGKSMGMSLRCLKD